MTLAALGGAALFEKKEVLGLRYLLRPTARDLTLAARKERPIDPWPRGQGHVILAWPGSAGRSKSYHEPGGSFSPAPGSFGISVWVIDRNGRRTATSDDLPLPEISERFIALPDTPVPALETQTAHYRLTTTVSQEGTRLQLSPGSPDTETLSLVIRSVGPAGGPIFKIRWAAPRLVINEHWTVEFATTPAAVTLGSERKGGWATSPSGEAARDANGWAYARVDFRGMPDVSALITEEQVSRDRDRPIPLAQLQSNLALEVPDRQFTAALQAQVAHLLMGLVADETRPGDPMNYSYAWQRDSAYVIAALARAGYRELARRLAEAAVRELFYGGFGSEADGPGLLLWALSEAAGPGDPEFDRRMWPHVARRAALIEEMRSAKEPVRYPHSGDVVPNFRRRGDLDLVAKPATAGLINGRMDWQFPALFVTAVSYRGLLAAADWAERLNESEKAASWRRAAGNLREAWAAALPNAADDPRTYASALWPSGIAVGDLPALRARLATHWQDTHNPTTGFNVRPLWTYYDIAEAHQWLRLGEPERAWTTLRWFWAQSPAPGLFTCWEGNGEENSSGLWPDVRGWVAPPHVTPHYWSSAEMLLLMLDMLAEVEEGKNGAVLVIGAGVPKQWLGSELRVDGIMTSAGAVGWSWRDGRVDVRIDDASFPVRLGPVFPPGTRLVVSSGGRVEIARHATAARPREP